jgi:hypothetical protein
MMWSKRRGAIGRGYLTAALVFGVASVVFVLVRGL